MKKFMFFVLVSGLFVASLSAQEALLEEANIYFNNENYSNAKDLYLQILTKGEFTGETLYRYVYSIEMLNGINAEILNLYSAAEFYLSMDGSNDQYLENCKSKLAVSSFDTTSLTWGKAQEIVKNYLKENRIKYSPLKSITNSLRSSDKIGLIAFLAIAIIAYVLAYSFSKKTTCIIIWGIFDLILVAISSLIFVYYLFDTENKIQNDALVNVIYFIMIIATFALSILSNLRYSGIKWPLFAAISVLTKMVLLLVIPLVLVLAIICWVLVNNAKKDKRYKDGTKNNAKTANYYTYVPIFTAIYTFLIVNLVKFDKQIKEAKNAD